MPENTDIPSSQPTGTKKSPFAGCLILIIAAVVMLSLVAWALWTLRYQESEIAKFTQESPAPVTLLKTEENQKELNSLAAEFKSFTSNIEKGQTARLALSAEDINLAIAEYELLKDFRNTFNLRKISEEGLEIDISYQLGNSPLSKRKNYLNGNMKAQVELIPEEVIIRISEIISPEGPVPAEFVDHMSTHRVMEVYKTHPTLGPLMRKLTSVTIEGNEIIALADTSSKPPSNVPEDMSPFAPRIIAFIGIFATIFLTIVAAILFFGHRMTKRRQMDASSDVNDA